MVIPTFSTPRVEQVDRLLSPGSLCWRATVQVVNPYPCQQVTGYGDTAYTAIAAALTTAEQRFRASELLRERLCL